MFSQSFVPRRAGARAGRIIARRGPLAVVATSLLLAASPAGDGRMLRTAAQAPADRVLDEVVLDPGLEPIRHPPGTLTASDGAFDPGLSRVPVRVGERRIDHRIGFLSALPKGSARIRLTGPFAGESGRLRVSGGSARPDGPGRWVWSAPERPGVQALRIVVPAARDSVSLNVFVLHPRERAREGALNGYRIGRYPAEPLRNDPAYARPPGFIELGADDEDLAVSPHFTLGQFACKQPGEPRYLVMSAPLVDKLERVLHEVNRSGRPVPTLAVMSGYRTPAYNRAIGNRTTYSRHLWGDAADVFVDGDGDDQMDDWNGDGRSTIDDARLLAGLVEEVTERDGGRVRPGGLASYRRNPVHGPFVHLDARGVRARW